MEVGRQKRGAREAIGRGPYALVEFRPKGARHRVENREERWVVTFGIGIYAARQPQGHFLGRNPIGAFRARVGHVDYQPF